MAISPTLPAAPDSELARFPVSEARWKHRPILILSSPEGETALSEQLTLLQPAAQALKERDVRVIHLRLEKSKLASATLDGQPLTLSDAEEWLGKLEEKRAQERFGIYLYGKDGGLKLERDTPTEVTKFTELIDTMPMRKEEAAGN